jgi:hypothetical protein
MYETHIEETNDGGYLITQVDNAGNESSIFIASYATQQFLDIYCEVTGERGPTH